ncbi:hypothetical protein V3C99_016539, partial [Haemonchus contortus]
EVKDVLTARYDAMEKHCQTGDIEKVAEFYHTDGVMIERGVSAAYGRAQIKNALQKHWDQTGPQKFTARSTDLFITIHIEIQREIRRLRGFPDSDMRFYAQFGQAWYRDRQGCSDLEEGSRKMDHLS